MTNGELIKLAEKFGNVNFSTDGEFISVEINDVGLAALASAIPAQKTERLKTRITVLEIENEQLKEKANTAEKWKGIALAKDGDGRTVSQIEMPIMERLAAAQLTIERMREAVERYGVHDEFCQFLNGVEFSSSGDCIAPPCNCGLSAAINMPSDTYALDAVREEARKEENARWADKFDVLNKSLDVLQKVREDSDSRIREEARRKALEEVKNKAMNMPTVEFFDWLYRMAKGE